ncbi:hypothetical protein CEXT_135981 [Caerostris extrusa]|uniref:Uncharacterized protein n=1 Tax=Caerostris extrusa TaxID=172846 RepID=A0AAV4PK03_CAEEX|nr:hypothetical protein CEXT_135981 [Caerostris extrusa]
MRFLPRATGHSTQSRPVFCRDPPMTCSGVQTHSKSLALTCEETSVQRTLTVLIAVVQENGVRRPLGEIITLCPFLESSTNLYFHPFVLEIKSHVFLVTWMEKVLYGGGRGGESEKIDAILLQPPNESSWY